MGAETDVYVECVVGSTTWVRVQAVTLDEAKEKACDIRGVLGVMRAQYDPPEDETGLTITASKSPARDE